MIVVESQKELDKLTELYQSNDSIVVPIFSDVNKHYVNNSISLLYINILNTENNFVLPINHIDTDNLEVNIRETLKTDKNVYVLNKKRYKQYVDDNDNYLDIGLINYFKTNRNIDETQLTDTHTFYQRKFFRLNNVNDIIPLTKHIEYCEFIVEMTTLLLFDFEVTDDFKYYNNIFINNLHQIETNGLFVDNTFGDSTRYQSVDNLVYSEYNIYTTTGRPSNKFNNVNFAALNKADGTRNHFLSRYGKNGFLVQFDYDAYHLRLIAEVIGYKFLDNISVHEYLGQQYFKTDDLTEEQYKTAKTISFRQLYGGTQHEYKHIPFFQQVEKYVNNLWDDYHQDTHIKTLIFRRKLHQTFFDDEINKYTLFNYLLQSLETERNMIILDDVNKYLVDKKTKMVLYTYDSFLFDFHMEDGKEILQKIKEITEKGGFLTKVEIGGDYGNMKSVDF